jgi:hypothetical protein
VAAGFAAALLAALLLVYLLVAFFGVPLEARIWPLTYSSPEPGLRLFID